MKIVFLSLIVNTLGSKVGLTLGLEVRIRDNDWRARLIHLAFMKPQERMRSRRQGVS